MYYVATKGKNSEGRWIVGYIHPEFDHVKDWIEDYGYQFGYFAILQHYDDITYAKVWEFSGVSSPRVFNDEFLMTSFDEEFH